MSRQHRARPATPAELIANEEEGQQTFDFLSPRPTTVRAKALTTASVETLVHESATGRGTTAEPELPFREVPELTTSKADIAACVVTVVCVVTIYAVVVSRAEVSELGLYAVKLSKLPREFVIGAFGLAASIAGCVHAVLLIRAAHGWMRSRASMTFASVAWRALMFALTFVSLSLSHPETVTLAKNAYRNVSNVFTMPPWPAPETEGAAGSRRSP